MPFALRAQIQFFAAISAGFAGCAEHEASQVTLEPTPPATSTPALTAKVEPVRVRSNDNFLQCPDYAKAERMCVAPKTIPSTGGNVLPPATYSSWDKNGCFQPVEIQGSCNGIALAMGPFFTGGQCCFEICQGPAAPCGRPLTIEGRSHVARVVPRADWSLPIQLDRGGDLRERAASAWRDDAAQEHASIASFARLSLELLTIGAPSNLVSLAHVAAQDEIEHARICFGIAAELSGGPALGPAPLAMDGMTLRSDLVSIACDAARGCVGETVAALALRRAARMCDAKALGRKLSKMAEDELSHAALGWQLVAWAWARCDHEAREAIRAALFVTEFDAPCFGLDDTDVWHRMGRLTHADMLEVVHEARALVFGAVARLTA